MIKGYIKDLHKRPENHRKKVTYVTSAGITLVIGLIWFGSFGYFHNIQSGNKELATNDGSYQSNTYDQVAVRDDNRPFAVVGSNLSNAYQGIRSAFGFDNSKSSKNNATGTLEYVPDK